MRTKKNEISVQVNVLFVLTAIFIALCLFIPVWQSAVSADLSKSLAKEEKKLDVLQDQKTVLKAAIEKQSNPEELMKRASLLNIDFTQISAQQKSVFASSLF